MTRRARWLALIMGAAFVIPACATTQIVAEQFHLPDGGEVAPGKVAFVELGCARCHRVHGQDDLPAPTVKPAISVILSEPGPSRATDARLVTGIINPDHKIADGWKPEVHADGGSRMRPYNDVMTVKQLLDIVAFLRSAEKR